MHNKVPYHLINKAVCGTLDHTEEHALNEWLASSQEHLSLFHTLEIIIDRSKAYSTNKEFDAATAYESFISSHLAQSPSEIDEEIWNLAKSYNPNLSFNKKKAFKKFSKKVSSQKSDSVEDQIWQLAQNYTPNVEFDGSKAFATFQSNIEDSKVNNKDSLWEMSAEYTPPVSFDSDKAVDRFFDKYKIHKEELGIDEQIWNLSKSYSPDILFNATEAAEKFITQNIRFEEEIVDQTVSKSELDSLVSNYSTNVQFDSNQAYMAFLAKYGMELAARDQVEQVNTTDKEAKVIQMKPQAMIMRIAASFAILIAAFMTWQSMSSPEMLKLTGPGEFVLSDASSVFLNADAVLTYPEKFAKDKREVKLDGEAYFDISKNPQKPFTIGVGEVNVDVLGTAFEITEIDDELVVVTVDEGVVKIENDGVVDTLTQGERAIANVLTGDIQSSINHYDNHAAWKDLGLSFEDVNIKDVLTEMEHFYGVTFDIQLSENHMGKTLLVGNQFKFTSIKDNLKVIEEVSKTKIKKVKPGHYLVTK